MADDIGHKATVKFEESLKTFTIFCNSKRTVMNEDNEAGVDKVVPMPQVKYNGTSNRVKNTHHMY